MSGNSACSPRTTTIIRTQLAGGTRAADDDIRARRADTLALARESDPSPIGESVMTAWAHLVTDALIAATAIAHGLPVVTPDAEFNRMADSHPPLRVIKV